jgi:hypothetical protein
MTFRQPAEAADGRGRGRRPLEGMAAARAGSAATMRTDKPQCTTQLATHAGRRWVSLSLPQTEMGEWRRSRINRAAHDLPPGRARCP